ncbi:amino acid transporter [Anaerocolumna cellulosilytica]|uniref:Amino acid transporter n=1 Tax=Anaerocolumna cellulosilytica TaxID=433286 RepID=A0A6S6QZQ2_9FIRM|nr:LysE family transporter [Anaerocolumna cellulosilytica]MBB5197320.1 threonine/homoserine/homoserine lactone efflux protein [Anaerocolumna cellulosilytica]BCJ92762.1 amino acid transporter [Anaerocolumna cellulosilytica]
MNQTKIQMFCKGFCFGMLLQIAVGPICFFILQTAANSGFLIALTGVLGVTLVDGLYILAAILGLGTFLDKYPKAKKLLQYSGALVLIVFGLSAILGSFHIRLLPSLTLVNSAKYTNVFINTLLLTLSNPLTILFWAGVFSAKIAEGQMKKQDFYAYGMGALGSTMFFLSITAALGSLMHTYIDTVITNGLNILIGIALLYFGIRTAFRKL